MSTTVNTYRKRPVEIEAVKFDRGADLVAILRWLGPAGYLESYNIMVIHTLEGNMRATWGWWIIKGVAGEFYPCRGDVFDATYEAAV